MCTCGRTLCMCSSFEQSSWRHCVLRFVFIVKWPRTIDFGLRCSSRLVYRHKLTSVCSRQGSTNENFNVITQQEHIDWVLILAARMNPCGSVQGIACKLLPKRGMWKLGSRWICLLRYARNYFSWFFSSLGSQDAPKTTSRTCSFWPLAYLD